MSDYKATIEIGDPEDIKENKLMAVLAYLLFFLPLIVCPQSRFARYHANQGLLLMIIYVGATLIANIFNIIPLINLIFHLLNVLAVFAVLILMIIGMINAGNGQMKPLPIIGGIRILK